MQFKKKWQTVLRTSEIDKLTVAPSKILFPPFPPNLIYEFAPGQKILSDGLVSSVVEGEDLDQEILCSALAVPEPQVHRETINPLMHPIPENHWLFSTFCCGCPYEEQIQKYSLYHLSEHFWFEWVKSTMYYGVKERKQQRKKGKEGGREKKRHTDWDRQTNRHVLWA